MGLSLNAADAKKADNFSSIIRDSGKYIGTITRAEKLLSKNKVEGLGLSIKTDDGASASYLDIYTVKPDGTKLQGYNLVQAILCCARVRSADDGQITFEKWDNNERRMVQMTGAGYPALMGKRIGLILQKELSTNTNTGEDTERLNIVGVFEAGTNLMSSEILDGKTKAEKIDFALKMIERTPVRDRRQKSRPAPTSSQTAGGVSNDDFDDSIPF